MSNSLDSIHKLPEKYKKSKKDICKIIRKASEHSKENKIEDNQEIDEEIYKGFTDLESIEKLIFDTVLDGKHDVFVLRLYVVKSKLDTVSKKIKGFFSRFVSEIGTAHLAVQISDKMVHWYDSSLVLVQGYEGSSATAVFYPQNEGGEQVPVLDNTPEIRRKICEVIQDYNCEKTYNLKRNNCQHFAQEIFKACGLQAEFSKFEGPVGYYLNYIIGKGRDSKNYACLIDTKGNVMVDENKKKLSWDDHKEFDIVCNEEGFLDKYASHCDLIKAFHRGFQMRERAAKKRDQECYQSDFCPFGMPTLLMDSRFNKSNINVYDIDTSFSFSSSFNIISGGSFSSNNN